MCWLLLLQGTMQHPSKLTLVLQSDDVVFMMFLNALEEFYDSVKYLEDKKYFLEFSQVLLQLKNASPDSGSNKKKKNCGNELARFDNIINDNFNNECVDVLKKVKECVHSRLGNL